MLRKLSSGLIAVGLLATSALSPIAAHAQTHPLREIDITTALGFTPPQIGTTTGTARDAGAAIQAELNAQNTANTTSSALTAEIARALAAENLRLLLSGGTLTGPLTLQADPTTAMGAATKQYADTKASIGSDGTLSAQTVKPTGSTTTHTLADTAALAYNSAQLDSNAKVLAASLVNRPQITPLTTTVGTTATTIYPAPGSSYIDVWMATPSTATALMVCTGDGSTPVLGALGDGKTAAPGQEIGWHTPRDPSPTGPIKCVASISVTIATGAI